MCGDNGLVEDTKQAIEQMSQHSALLWQSIIFIILIGSFNATGQAVTKYASSAQRATIDTCRTLFVWIF